MYYLLINGLLAVLYAVLINYLTRNDLDGWGVAIFSYIAVYSHCLVGTGVSILIRRKYLQSL